MTEGRGLSIFDDEPEESGESQRRETAADEPTVVIPVGAGKSTKGAPSAPDDTSSARRHSDATRTQAIPAAKADEVIAAIKASTIKGKKQTIRRDRA